MADLKALSEAVIKGDQNLAPQLTQEALDEGVGPETILADGLIAGMNYIGVRFKANEVYIPEVLIAARAMKMAMATKHNHSGMESTLASSAPFSSSM